MSYPNFEYGGILPTHETQAKDFISSFPKYNGKGVIVAVLDTGICLKAEGLQVCPDGSPKVIDCIGKFLLI